MCWVSTAPKGKNPSRGKPAKAPMPQLLPATPLTQLPADLLESAMMQGKQKGGARMDPINKVKEDRSRLGGKMPTYHSTRIR
jgi:hypothetical protein